MKKVLLGMSGGVDSSVSAILLQKEGYEVIGITMALSKETDDTDAKAVCKELGIEHHFVDLKSEFKKYVIDNFIKCYANAKTPNPCIECNRKLKFGAMFDKAKELSKKDKAIGTTGKGIGPAYTDKVARNGIRMVDLRSFGTLEQKVTNTINDMQILQEKYAFTLPSVDSVMSALESSAKVLLPFVCDTTQLLWKAQEEGKKILCEGAQGSMLDIDHGTYPFVTSSSTTASGACSGTGLAPRDLKEVIGVAKAYCTRVGNGVFPTEDFGNEGEYMRQKGAEFGTTTGRSRRCGWFDAVAVKYACRLNGCTKLGIMKMDVLDGLETIKVCTAYEYKGKTITYIPTDYENVKPIYTEFAGWESVTNIRDESKLPKNAKAYIDFLEQYIGVKISLISTSPEREDVIVR